jgi:hypothetical protein
MRNELHSFTQFVCWNCTNLVNAPTECRKTKLVHQNQKKTMNTSELSLSNEPLRLEQGNYILIGNSVKIVQRVDGGIVYCKTYTKELNQEIDVHYFSQIEPIPITEKWLMDLGFNDRREVGKGFENKGIRFWFENGEITIQSYNQTKNWKNVHELQNLVYWLSGENIELK